MKFKATITPFPFHIFFALAQKLMQFEMHATNQGQVGIIPKVDLLQISGQYKLFVELPGFRKEDISLTMHGQQRLLIKGKLLCPYHENSSGRGKFTSEVQKHFFEERLSGGFLKTINLRLPVDVTRVRAELANGVLSVSLPIVPTLSEQEIKIN